MIEFLAIATDSDEEARAEWAMRAWENSDLWFARNTPASIEAEDLNEQDAEHSPEQSLPAEWLPFIVEGETRWSIERNAAAAGFVREMDYLEWRRDSTIGGAS